MSKLSQHEVIALIKQCALKLGHAPSREEFRHHGEGISTKSIEQVFGTWSAAIIAAGLQKQIVKSKPGKIEQIDDQEIIQKLIRQTTDRKVIRLNSYKKIICLPDIHFPFVNHDAMTMVYYLIEKEKPDVVIQLGDLYDLYSFSRFPRSLNIYTPKAEWNLAREMAVEMWRKIKEIVPNAECFQLRGNHDIRAEARTQERVPETSHLLDEATQRAFSFDGVTTIMCPQEEFFISDIAFIHGHYSGMGKHRDYMRMNVVHGHDHNQYVVQKPVWNEQMQVKTIWEMSCGLLGDPFSAALSYRAQRIHNWITGIGIIDEFGPRTIAF